MSSYFASDYHFGHSNVILYDGRPFKDVWEMDEQLIENHNFVVGEKDDFYFLGDFSFNKARTEEYLSRLNGNKFFIKGNHDHDHTIKLYEEFGTYLGELKKVVVEGQEIVLCHYALRTFEKQHRGAFHLYGHSHHSLPEDPNSLSFDVGINGAEYNYTPISFDEVKKKMSKKKYIAEDHHRTSSGPLSH